MAEIKWLGHACFRIRGREVAILTDPAGPESGYAIGPQQAEIVTVSHDHPGHRALDLVQPGYRLISGPGEYEIHEVFIRGVRTDHDAEGGARAGKNTAYVIEVDDLVVCHLGDLGHVLSEEQAAAMNSVDVLLVPIGGGPTIGATQAAEVIGQLEPTVVIPMQYRTERGDLERDPLERFLKEVGVTEFTPLDRVTIRKSDLGETMRVVVLRP
ncbi:MAG TPA: MBL fold metallo-hydrolase [Thermomicrobiaceae bacterium]|nr:MBL fold metallo-hydrolase [Thermomicrobiaceae bacterium]